jgi:hypothetical protein
MDERRAARLAAAVAEQGGELEPPWARFPWISRYSIGWRMGSGESYMVLWSDFVDERIETTDEALEYLRRHPPAPRTWADWIAHWLGQLERDRSEAEELDEVAAQLTSDGDDDDGEDELFNADDYDDVIEDDDDLDDDDDFDEDSEEAQDAADEAHWVPLLARERLIADDAAYPVFVRNALAKSGGTGHLPAPWAARGAATPEDALRYSSRELGWWARWLHDSGVDFATYLATQPPAPEAWEEAVRGVSFWSTSPGSSLGISLWKTLDGGAVSLIPVMVRLGALPPPWLGGHPPIADIEWEEDSDDRHRWAWWVFDTFEDAASWRAYLERWPPPPAWRDALKGYLFPTLSGE